MGHMDVEKFTVTIYHEQGNEIFHGCTDVNLNDDRNLNFDDTNGKRHSFHEVSFHVAQE